MSALFLYSEAHYFSIKFFITSVSCMGEKQMSITKFKMLSNKLKALLLGSVIAWVGVLAIAPAVTQASTLQDLLPAPVLISPHDGALIVVPVPTFSWQAVGRAVSYNVE